MSASPPQFDDLTAGGTVHGVAARAGVWSARHRKTAIWGWLAFVVLALFIGNAVGTKTLEHTQGSVGDSGKADQAIADAASDKCPILFDSGIRTGADMFKALALGASAVLLGRPYVYALACGSASGVRETIRNLLAEFDLTMGLSGCHSLAGITPCMLRGS